jgi:hypothetical protein
MSKKLRLILIIMLLCSSNLLKAQQNTIDREEKKSTAKPAARSRSASDYYSEQAEQWKNRTRMNPAEAASWFNLYTSRRYALLASEKKITPIAQKSLDQLAAEIATKIPGSFESELITYLNGNKDMKLLPHLQKAYEISPGRTETYPELIAVYELKGDQKNRQLFCKKLYQSKHFDEQIMNYNYNTLMSVEQNAILFTNGDNDTYPAWMLQEAEGVRKDVTVINTNLIEKPDYRKKIMAAAGISEPAGTDYLNDKPLYLSRLAAANPARPIYFSMTLGKLYTKQLTGNLYVTGLAFRHSTTPFENLPVLQENMERRFRKTPTGYEPVEANVSLNSNYVIPMLLLMDYYSSSNRDKQKSEELKNSAIRIAGQAGQTDVVNRYINNGK